MLIGLGVEGRYMSTYFPSNWLSFSILISLIGGHGRQRQSAPTSLFGTPLGDGRLVIVIGQGLKLLDGNGSAQTLGFDIS